MPPLNILAALTVLALAPPGTVLCLVWVWRNWRPGRHRVPTCTCHDGHGRHRRCVVARRADWYLRFHGTRRFEKDMKEVSREQA